MNTIIDDYTFMDKKKYVSPLIIAEGMALEGIIAESNTELIDDGEEHDWVSIGMYYE